MGVDTQSIGIRDLIRIIFRHKFLIVIPIIPAVLTAYVITELPTPTYISSVKMMVVGQKDVEGTYFRAAGLDRGTATIAELVRSRSVLERVVIALKLYETPPDYERNFASPLRRALIDYTSKKHPRPEINWSKATPEERGVLVNNAIAALSGSVGTQIMLETSMFTISVSDFSPYRAAIIANSVSRSYLIYDIEQKITELKLVYGEKHRRIVELKRYIEELQKTLDGKLLPDMDAFGPASIKIVGQAIAAAPDVKLLLEKMRKRFVVLLMSLVLGVVIAILKEYFDQTIKTPIDIEKNLNMPYLGFISKRKLKDKKDKLPVSRNPGKATDYTRSYESLTEQLALLMKDKNLKSILITGVEPSEDVATVIGGIGINSARKGSKKVLIIDANFRNPSLAKILKISDNPGLVDTLEGKIFLEDAVQNVEPNLSILPSGNININPIALLSSSNMNDLMKTFKEKYDIIFVSCSNLKDFPDAAIISSIMDGIILVISEGETKRPVIMSALAPLGQKKANILGAILNNRTFPIPKWIYDRF